MMVPRVINREENLQTSRNGRKMLQTKHETWEQVLCEEASLNLFVMNSSLFFSSNMFVNCSDSRQEVVPRHVFFPPVSSSIKDAANILGRQRKTHLEETQRKHPSPNHFSSSGCHERPFRQGPLNATYLFRGNKQALR